MVVRGGGSRDVPAAITTSYIASISVRITSIGQRHQEASVLGCRRGRRWLAAAQRRHIGRPDAHADAIWRRVRAFIPQVASLFETRPVPEALPCSSTLPRPWHWLRS